MKVAVLGSGVIGVTTAWYLLQRGHEVTVYDRQPGPALETSYANAGEISPGYSTPWAAPGIPIKAVRWMFMKHAPLILRPKADAAMLSWMVQMLWNCTAEAYQLNKSRMLRIANYSRDSLVALRQETGIAYDHRSLGTVQLFRKQSQVDHAAHDTEILKRDGVAFEILDRAGVIAAEPALARSTESFVGALRLPEDETGDCFKFTNALAALCVERGVRFVQDTAITALTHETDRVTGVVTDKGPISADHYVLALGSFSPLLARSLGLRLPVYPVKGYSLTAPITDAALAPQSTLLDETYKIAVTRLGDRIRVGGMAEISGYTTNLPPARRATLEYVASGLFPGGDYKAAEYWSGLRPMTPDGTPIVGRTPYRNLSINTGHGTLGWTMACGSGRLLADLISGQKGEIRSDDLGLSRY
ncbi:D-amino acid dehydrogenase [Oryzibacter oryziterrae]|uniref:D-amino acid dehydrogenase n=1 Tax=Oryzibacter oryziterrae TaxID=2766474 RepID=UPI001F2628AE|nr:D-amino acid dehydrogenase [Oryzibacter oryziterrae]